MNKKMFSEAVKKGIAAAKQKRELADEGIVLESVIEVDGPRGSKWIVRRTAVPHGYNPNQYAMIAAENLQTGKQELITITMYDQEHNWGNRPAGAHAQYYPNYGRKFYYMTYHGVIVGTQIPQYVRDAVEELAATLSEARLEESKNKTKKRRKTTAR
jgi:hypothetical protein